VTLTEREAVAPVESVTVQVTVAIPGAAGAVNVTEGPEPEIVPRFVVQIQVVIGSESVTDAFTTVDWPGKRDGWPAMRELKTGGAA
jgi:hypothetical protein